MNNTEKISLFYRRVMIRQMLKEAGNSLSLSQLQKYNSWGYNTIWETLRLVESLNLFRKVKINNRDKALELTPKGEQVLKAMLALEEELVK
jgi:predicted transcriptional regulator